jgi:ABC-type protease/lipase transport system fused ATPase/permease subunit
MIHRLQQAMVVGRLARFPAVAIVGPRQAGKTTLAKKIGGYFDLEQESERVRLDLIIIMRDTFHRRTSAGWLADFSTKSIRR